MIANSRMNNPRALMVLGMGLLAFANLIHWFLRRSSTVSENLIDGTYGLTMGLAIAVLVLAMILRRKMRR